MERLSTYNIAFKGLKEGNHVFDFHISNSFFELFENSLVERAEVDVQILIEKQSSFLVLHIKLDGTLNLTCDRCLELYDQPVKNKAFVYIKYGEKPSEEGDDVIWILPDEHQINVAQLIYEYIAISVPLKHIHPDAKGGKNSCNPEMLKIIKEYTRHEEKTDGRWDKLKNILNNN